MIQREFSIEINAPSNKVWYALWDMAHYKKWTQVFCEGSYAETDGWKENTIVHFLTPTGEGMFSKIVKHETMKEMHFSHQGKLKDFKEQPIDDETQEWIGAKEVYTIEERNNGTVLKTYLEVYEKYDAFFSNVFPKGLEKVKELAEDLYIHTEAYIYAPLDRVWNLWTTPTKIVRWCSPSPEWHTVSAMNDMKVGGKFEYRLEAKDGSMGFDIPSIIDEYEPLNKFSYTMSDGRKVNVSFIEKNDQTQIIQEFQPESQNSLEMQQLGWQSILNNFKRYAEQSPI